MGLIAFMHDYEFVRLGFFVLQTSEHFVPLPPSLTLLLPSLEFALPVSSALALSRTREKENERKRESSTHLCPPYRGFSALFSRHPLTHSSTRSLVPRSTRPRALPPPLSFNHPPRPSSSSSSSTAPLHLPISLRPPPLRLPFLFTLVRCPIICPRPRRTRFTRSVPKHIHRVLSPLPRFESFETPSAKPPPLALAPPRRPFFLARDSRFQEYISN